VHQGLRHASSHLVIFWLACSRHLEDRPGDRVATGKGVDISRGHCNPVGFCHLHGVQAVRSLVAFGLLALALFDFITVALVLNEWRSHHAGSA